MPRQARSPSITNPSHASILTGEPMTVTGVLGNLAPISARANMVAEAFQDVGFRTFASVSARHMNPPRSGFGQGFERFDAGFGLGVERTVAWLCGLHHVRETIPFARTLDRIWP